MTARRPDEVFDRRLEGIWRELGTHGLDGLIVFNPASVAYLTGFEGMALERLIAAAVTPGSITLVAPLLEQEAVAGLGAGMRRSLYDASSDGTAELIAALSGARRIGVEEDSLSWARGRHLQQAGFDLVPAGGVVMTLRTRKDAAELEAIGAACRQVEAALEHLFTELRPGVTEREANARIDCWMRQAGASDTHPLVLFGPNGAAPHARPGPRELAVGDVVCADLSARFDGYWADLTRCATVGPAVDWALQAWEVVSQAHAAAIDATRPGNTARDVDAAQRRIVEAAGQVGQCLHGAGHAIGLEVHEPPFLTPRGVDVLETGMVFTIEPGIYKPGTGGVRLEDDVAVAEDVPVVLSRMPLDLREIPI